jgi:hypothetical protein
MKKNEFKFVFAEDQRTYCPNCNYTARPTVFYSERKHGDFYRFECSRCLYSSESVPHIENLIIDWGKESDKKTIHDWFNLTYASYLVVPRSVLQSMPKEWQCKFISLLDEMNETIEWDEVGNYTVQMRNDEGKFIEDPYRDYQRGRRVIAKRNTTNNNLK